MLKDFIIASTLTILFSVGVGVLFVQTIFELFHLFIKENKPAQEEKNTISVNN